MAGPPLPTPERIEALADNLETLGSPVRLRLLSALRTPKALHEIRIVIPERRGGQSLDRPLARQTITRHLVQLQRAGLVRRNVARAKGDTYVINHERVFALVDELRNLAKLRPVVMDVKALGETIDKATLGEPRLPEGPRLLVAYGRDDGVGYALAGPAGSRWRVGRSSACEIQIDYDPYVSMENSLIERTANGFKLTDLRSHNGTWLNWSPLPPETPKPLRAGDLLGVGRSLLVFQP